MIMEKHKFLGLTEEQWFQILLVMVEWILSKR